MLALQVESRSPGLLRLARHSASGDCELSAVVLAAGQSRRAPVRLERGRLHVGTVCRETAGNADEVNEITPSGKRPRSLVIDFDVVVVGAGQAGLAMGYFLARRGLRFVISWMRPIRLLRLGVIAGSSPTPSHRGVTTAFRASFQAIRRVPDAR